MIWLSNLIEAWDMYSFVEARYKFLGKGSHWFPGNNANELDRTITENELIDSIRNHINPEKVISKLRGLKNKFGY